MFDQFYKSNTVTNRITYLLLVASWELIPKLPITCVKRRLLISEIQVGLGKVRPKEIITSLIFVVHFYNYEPKVWHIEKCV